MAAGQLGSLRACQNETAPAVPLQVSAVSQPTDELLVRECLQDLHVSRCLFHVFCLHSHS